MLQISLRLELWLSFRLGLELSLRLGLDRVGGGSCSSCFLGVRFEAGVSVSAASTKVVLASFLSFLRPENNYFIRFLEASR